MRTGCSGVIDAPYTTDNHVVLFTYKPINDRLHTLQLRQKLRLDIRDFSYSVYSTEKWMGAVHAEIEHLLKESNIRNPGYFVFANTSMFFCVGSWAEVFAKPKLPYLT